MVPKSNYKTRFREVSLISSILLPYSLSFKVIPLYINVCFILIFFSFEVISIYVYVCIHVSVWYVIHIKECIFTVPLSYNKLKLFCMRPSAACRDRHRTPSFTGMFYTIAFSVFYCVEYSLFK